MSKEEAPLSVSELVVLVKETLERQFAEVLVTGELAAFKRHTSGHCYFSLADDASGIDAVMWRGSAARLAFDPKAGDEVLCRGHVGVYEKTGRMQLYVSSMRPIGAGAAQRALEALRKKLDAEGLFDPSRKRALPYFPSTVGVVTSRSGAAIDDILTTIHRRFPACRVLVSPSAVQGPSAPAELVAALALLAAEGSSDVVIIGRGGGAAEDLSAFNDEAVVRAVAAFPIPIVSAVGHEMDTSLCDLAADLRAATPTGAGEAVVPVLTELREDVDDLDLRLRRSLVRRVEELRHRVGSVRGRLRDPVALVARARQRTDDLTVRLERALLRRHSVASESLAEVGVRLASAARTRERELRERVAGLKSRLEAGLRTRALGSASRAKELSSRLYALSPVAVLERGYSLAMTADGRLVRAADEIAAGDRLELRFARGKAGAEVIWTTEEDA